MNCLNKGKIQPNAAGILVVDSNRTMVSLNRNFLDLWSLSKHLIMSRDDEQVLKFVCKQFEYPKSFFKEVKEIYMQQHLEIHDTIQLKDGRIFERHSQPQWLEDKYVGRLWMFSCIAESRLANNLLESSVTSCKYPIVVNL
ncbi:hypothetical protein [Nostoc sp. 'Peltigera membranacea cyanobiont' 232]|uniref:hypothetical protein n=1 Tax=Nostoc sp. 'Peltigera membranacea cyanobiont' 232 TaxID=2014531 RepID=UPI000B954ACF|nr:hypothetical protein [Nostoc sp. 'Peltigera membranacea cyanobiont' 232]OYE02677.1 hypothetical protein CDG79_22725 [Nostoc sp. 'Peltigera membranacea cyanobiont' 232]